MNTDLIIGFAGILLSVLTYFAGVKRQRNISTKEARQQRIQRVVDRYLSIERRVMGIHDLLRAGVLTLHDADEVYEACSTIVEHNMPSPLHNLSTRLDDSINQKEILDFLEWFQRERNDTTKDFHNQKNFAEMLEAFRMRPVCSPKLNNRPAPVNGAIRVKPRN